MESNDSRGFPRVPAWLPFLAGVAGFLAALTAPLFVLGWDPNGFRPAPGDYARHSALLWLAVISAEGTVCLFTGAWTVWRILNLVQTESNRVGLLARTILPTLAVGLAFFLLIARISENSGFPPVAVGAISIPNLAAFRLTALLVAGVACSGIVLTWAVRPASADGGSLTWIRRCHNVMTEFLFAASTNLALSVLSAAALRNALEAAKVKQYAPDFVLTYGAVHSILILAVYLPARFSLRVETERAVARLLPLPETIDAVKGWTEKRAVADEYLGNTTKSILGAGGAAATILPLLTGWITQLLK